MTRIHPSIASHRLNVMPSSRPVRQKVQRFHLNRQKIIQTENRQVASSRIYQRSRVSRLVGKCGRGAKNGGKWQVCVDYTNLNDVYPKNSFSLPRMDQIVDSTARHGMLSFLDAFSGYYQIPMYQPYEEKTAFITPHGLYCYRVMPFGLKNVGATYQRLMTKIFKPLIGHTIEVYIDDIMVKSRTRGEHTWHLEETFRLIKAYNMKQNPAKCAFGDSTNKFLGFMVTQRGIEVNPNQIKVVMETFPPSSKKKLQCLTGHLAALGHFIACFTNKLRHFFLTLKAVSMTEWTSDCEQAFEEIKRYLTQSPILSNPQPSEELYMYLVVFDWAVIVVLFHHEKDKEQRPIYYVSKAMVDAEIRYSKME